MKFAPKIDISFHHHIKKLLFYMNFIHLDLFSHINQIQTKSQK